MSSSKNNRKAVEPNLDNLKIPYDEAGNILVAQLVESAKKMGSSISKHMLSYFSESKQVFIYFGTDPLPADLTINGDDVGSVLEVRPSLNSVSLDEKEFGNLNGIYTFFIDKSKVKSKIYLR